jgi:hypothetical protein
MCDKKFTFMRTMSLQASPLRRTQTHLHTLRWGKEAMHLAAVETAWEIENKCCFDTYCFGCV